MLKNELDLIFEKKYKSLNNKQKMAVDAIEGPVMVIAGPGTGKTTILTLRIGNILKKTDNPASGILTLTFTDAGVKAIKMKLREIIGSRADDVRIHTFHSFASSIISEFPEHFPHLSKSKQITDVEAESMIRDILKNKKFAKLRPLGDTDFYIHKILSAIGDSKKEDWDPEIIRKFAKEEIDRIENDPSSLSSRGASKGSLKADSLKRIERCQRTILFADVFEEYELSKISNKKIDYDDLLVELNKSLKNDELLLRLLQEKFLYILVDEHQDTNDSQNLIVSMLSNFFETPNIFVVGDEKQAIYRFQGASVANFLRFQNIWKDMKVISLEENYRSHQDILDATFKMIEQNYEEGDLEDLRVELKSGLKKEKRPIDVIFSGDTDSADAYLIEELQNISKNEPEATVAVILRWNRDVDHILSLCESHGVFVSAERGADIFSHPLGSLYFKILEYLSDPSKTDSLTETIALNLWGLDFEKSNNLIKRIRSGNIKDIEKEIEVLSVLHKEINILSPIAYLIFVGEVSGLISPDKMTDPLSVEVWRGIIDLARNIAGNSKIENSFDLIKELLDYKKTSENKVIKIGSGSVDAKIQIMTAHSSKGLEFDYVFVPYALEEYWIRRPQSGAFVLPREEDNSDDIKDSRRLFYVALTRAKKHLVIIVPTNDNLGKDFTPLRFVEELHPGSVNKIEAPQIKSLPKILKGESLNSHRKSELVEYSKRVLIENGLSVTALNHFMKCPSEFLYKSILKVPEAPNASSEKGTAMHKAMSSVWANEDKRVSSITKTIEDSVKSYFETSLLPKAEKEIILEELILSAGSIAKSLENHFSMKGTVQTDKWMDFIFKTKYKNKQIELKLHGQLDVLVFEGENSFVFDYKTRQVMSENAIKGETKNTDGNYFRQLIFYKILVEGNSQFAGKNMELALVFIKPDEKGRCPVVSISVSKEDADKVKDEVSYLLENVYSGEFLDRVCDDPDCKWCPLKKYSIK
ncbi:MAG: ATP-dependent DNA helicase [Candidatus Paceibacterota bacterium]